MKGYVSDLFGGRRLSSDYADKNAQGCCILLLILLFFHSPLTCEKGRDENAFIEGRPTADMKAKLN